MSISVKISRGNETRRIELSTSDPSFEQLHKKITQLFRLGDNNAESLQYWDELDWVTVSSDDEVKEMMKVFTSTSTPLRIRLERGNGNAVRQIAETVRPVVNQIAGGMGAVYEKVKPQVEQATQEGLNLAQKVKPFAQNVYQEVQQTAGPVAQQVADKVAPLANHVSAQISPVFRSIEDQLKSNASFQQMQGFISDLQEEIWELNRGMKKSFENKSNASSSSSQTNTIETNEASTATELSSTTSVGTAMEEVQESERAPEKQWEDDTPEELKTLIHYAICDGCKSRICGWRHKCEVCPDYDLCHKCYSTSRDSVHPGHNFEQIGKSVKPVTVKKTEEDGMNKEKLEESVKILQDMGFTDKTKIIRAIINNKNDLVKAVMELLD